MYTHYIWATHAQHIAQLFSWKIKKNSATVIKNSGGLE